MDKKFCVHKRFQVAAGEVLGYVRAYPVGRIAKPDSKSGLKERQHRPAGQFRSDVAAQGGGNRILRSL